MWIRAEILLNLRNWRIEGNEENEENQNFGYSVFLSAQTAAEAFQNVVVTVLEHWRRVFPKENFWDSEDVRCLPFLKSEPSILPCFEYKILLMVIFCTFWKFVFSVLLRCTKVLRRRKASKQHPRQPKSKQCVGKSYQEVLGPHSPCVLTKPWLAEYCTFSPTD